MEDIDISRLYDTEDCCFSEPLSCLKPEQFNLIINFAKKIKPKNWSLFFELMLFIMKQDNYQELLEKLGQKLSLAHQSSIFLLLTINKNSL